MVNTLESAFTGIILLYLTVSAAIAEKYLFTCVRKDGKDRHIEGVTNKGLYNFVRYGHFFSIVGGFAILLIFGRFWSRTALSAMGTGMILVGSVILLSLVSGIMLAINDTRFEDGHMIYRSKTNTNWNFIRFTGLYSMIVILLLDMFYLGAICGQERVGELYQAGVAQTGKFRSPFRGNVHDTGLMSAKKNY